MFLLYINDIPQALSDSHTHLYEEDISIFFYQHKNVREIENIFKNEFTNIFKWFVYNKLSIRLGEDKAKCIPSSRYKYLPELNITYNKNRIKQFYIVEHLGCYLDANLRGESIHGIETS